MIATDLMERTPATRLSVPMPIIVRRRAGTAWVIPVLPTTRTAPEAHPQAAAPTHRSPSTAMREKERAGGLSPGVPW